MQGKTLMQARVTGRTGNLEWGTEMVDDGVYFYSVRFGNGKSDVAKLVIIK